MGFVTHDQQVEFLEQQKANITLTHYLMLDRQKRQQDAQRKFREDWEKVMKGAKLQ